MAADLQYPFTMWRWTVTDELTKRRRQTRYLMTEEEARARYGADAEKVPWTERVIAGPSSDFGAWGQKQK